MQWIAVLAAIGWSFLQVFMLFIATQCVFALVELRSKTENIYQKLLSRSIILLFYSLFILPLISLGVFYYQVGLSYCLRYGSLLCGVDHLYFF